MSRYFGAWTGKKVPTNAFVDEFLELTGIFLAAGNSKFYIHSLTALTNEFTVDILAIDEFFDNNDDDYDSEQCTYKDQEEVSMKKYIQLKFGDKVSEMVQQLVDGTYPYTIN